jgi:type III secretion protein I
MDIHTLATATLANAQPAAAAAAAPGPADPQAAARFRSMMGPQQAALAPDPASAVPVPQAGTSLGDAILKKVDEVHADMESQWDRICSIGQPQHALSVTELLQFQSNLMQSSVQFDLTGKVVSKSEQDLDTLVKMQ